MKLHNDHQTSDLEPTKASTLIFAILCILPVLSTLLFGGVDTIVLGLFAVFAAFLISLWTIDAWKMQVLHFRPNVLLLPLVGLILIGFLQLAPLSDRSSADGALGIEPVSSLSLDPFATRLFVVRLLTYLIFAAAAFAFINTRKRVNILSVTTVIFGSFVAFFGILQRLSNLEAIYGLRPTPQAIPFGPFINQHHFAGFMELTIGLALGMLLGTGLKPDKKAFLILASVIMATAMVFTGSRGGVLSFAGVVFFVVVATYFSRGQKRSESRTNGSDRLGAIVIGAAFGLIVIGTAFYLGAGDSLLRGVGVNVDSSDISSGRIHFWGVAWQIFKANPIFGTGLDSFGVAFTQFDTRNGAFRVENAHNEYVQALADSGIAGFLCVVAFVVLLFRKGVKAINSSKDALSKSITIGALSGCFGICIHSFFDFPLRTPSNALFFLLLVVLGTTVFQKSKAA